jgi:hypothetical protein
MTVIYHPDFAPDISRFESDYEKISSALGRRFREEVDEAIELIKRAPGGAGHFLQVQSMVVKMFRRRNLRSFPFFVLYAVFEEKLIFGSVIASRSDPLTWLTRFKAN